MKNIFEKLIFYFQFKFLLGQHQSTPSHQLFHIKMVIKHTKHMENISNNLPEVIEVRLQNRISTFNFSIQPTLQSSIWITKSFQVHLLVDKNIKNIVNQSLTTFQTSSRVNFQIWNLHFLFFQQPAKQVFYKEFYISVNSIHVLNIQNKQYHSPTSIR